VIQRFERHSGRERPVADDGDRAAILAPLGGRNRHAERRTDGGAGVTDTERIVVALAPRRERRETLSCLMVCNSSRRPVSTLWGYAWWPTSQTNRSSGVL